MRIYEGGGGTVEGGCKQKLLTVRLHNNPSVMCCFYDTKCMKERSYKDAVTYEEHGTILSLDNSWLHLVQILFDPQLFVLDHLLLLVHSFLDLLAHHLESHQQCKRKH